MLLISLSGIALQAEAAEAQIASPRLSYLDTNNGLNQDTINDIHIDKEGFVWIATDEGLNRFDGVKVLDVNGKTLELTSNSVIRIHEHSAGLFFLSTADNGVVTLDRETMEINPILRKPYTLDPTWYQTSEAMLELSDGNMLLALNEEIYIHDVSKGTNTLVWQMTDDQKSVGNFIRSIYMYDDILLIGTRDGFFAYNLQTQISKDLFEPFDLPIDSINVKYLNSFDGENLLIGTVQGLFTYPLGEIYKFVNEQWELSQPKIIHDTRNIWDIDVAENGLAYVATDIGLFELDTMTLEFTYLFEPRKNVEILSQLDIKNVVVDNYDNLWMGTSTSGAMYWSSASLYFNNVYNSIYSKDTSKLSNNQVWAIFQSDADSLYVGTTNGINLYDLNTGEIEQYYVQESGNAQYTEFDIYEIEANSKEILWLHTGVGIRKFDTASKSYVPFDTYSEEVQDLFNTYLYSFQLVNKHELWLIQDTGIHIVNLSTNEIRTVDIEAYGLSILSVNEFMGMDIRTNSVLLSVATGVWAIDINSLAVRQLHSIKNETSSLTAYAGDWLRTYDNHVWVSYPGFGLYKLDGNTLKVLEKYSSENYLPSDLMYGLMLDNEGDLWFSSHSGIHSLDAKNKSVQTFSFVNGLASSEFNQGANEKLVDGRFIYGGNLGFTIFSPRQIIDSQSIMEAPTTITELSLTTRNLDLPLSSLNNASVNLNHNDLGITLYFSSLSFDLFAVNRYQYRITSDNDVVNYPSINSNKITLPMLSPGAHVIEVFKPGVDDPDKVAKITINVAYPPFASPLAYFMYAFLVLAGLSFAYWRQKHTQALIKEANYQVTIYNKRLQDALHASNSNIWEWDSETKMFRSERIRTELKPSESGDQDALELMPFDEYLALIHEADRLHFRSKWQAFIQGDELSFDISYRVKTLSNKTLWYRDVGSLTLDKNGHKTVKGTYTNLTDSVASQEKLKLFGNAFKHTRDWVLIFNKNKQLIATNPAFKMAFGLHKDGDTNVNQNKLMIEHQEALHRTIKQLGTLRAGQRWKTESNIVINSQQMTLLTDFYAVAQENHASIIDYYLIIATDITDQINAQKELQKLANYDVLTGLINRTLLVERLKQSIHFCKRHNTMLAALFIDLDGFKPVNDTFGHIAGDIVLTEIANRLREQFREQDSVARLGGDEFVLVLEEVNDIQDINKIATNLLLEIEKPITIGKQSVSVSGSIGVAIYPNDALDAEHLLRNADIAMYSAKQEGSNCYRHFTEAMNEQVQSTTILQNKIKIAAAKNAFLNYYQPIVNIQTGENAGFEMLMRWHEDGQFISPGQFIPVAEQMGCIIDMTMHAIKTAILDLSHWYKEGFTGYVAINLSAKQFATRPDIESILECLNQYKLPTSCLRFEITESLLVNNDVNTISYMQEMRDKGFKLALDDFGTGYSSLSYIKDFPLDVLKIDRSFVQDVTENKGTESIVQSTLMMTDLLGLDTVAEGIETNQQLQYFQEKKCKYVQGFFFSMPIPFQEASQCIHRNWLNKDNPLNSTKNKDDSLVYLHRSK